MGWYLTLCKTMMARFVTHLSSFEQLLEFARYAHLPGAAPHTHTHTHTHTALLPHTHTHSHSRAHCPAASTLCAGCCAVGNLDTSTNTLFTMTSDVFFARLLRERHHAYVWMRNSRRAGTT